MDVSVISEKADRLATAGSHGDGGSVAGYDAICGDYEACRLIVDLRTLIVERIVGGLCCRISLPAAHYDGVALMVAYDGQDKTYSVRLMHRDPALTLTISGLADLGAALDLRDGLARQLRLPALAISHDGEISGDETKIGGLIARTRQDRRGSMATGRRPRFLARRKDALRRASSRICGREITART